MTELADDLEFAIEALDVGRVHRLQELDGDHSTASLVGRAVHGAHRAGIETADDAISTLKNEARGDGFEGRGVQDESPVVQGRWVSPGRTKTYPMKTAISGGIWA